MLSENTISVARAEAEEFIRRADALIYKMDQFKHYLSSGTRESSALRRQSMELTRALADLRRPGC